MSSPFSSRLPTEAPTQGLGKLHRSAKQHQIIIIISIKMQNLLYNLSSLHLLYVMMPIVRGKLLYFCCYFIRIAQQTNVKRIKSSNPTPHLLGVVDAMLNSLTSSQMWVAILICCLAVGEK